MPSLLPLEGVTPAYVDALDLVDYDHHHYMVPVARYDCGEPNTVAVVGYLRGSVCMVKAIRNSSALLRHRARIANATACRVCGLDGPDAHDDQCFGEPMGESQANYVRAYLLAEAAISQSWEYAPLIVLDGLG